jgi:Sulfotransferase family
VAPSAAGWPPPKPEQANADSVPAPIVFVGGTGRSGTHVISRLLGHHPAYADVRIEARFHAKPQGIPDLLAGEVTVDEFERKLRRFWWYRVAAGEPLPAILPRVPLGRSVRGLHKTMPRKRFERALRRFRRRWERDQRMACRRLFLDLLWPVAAGAEKPGLVEMTTSTTMHARTLLTLFPEARFVHSVRDGRDSGSSKVSKRQRSHHPRDAEEGFEWWLDRLERIERGIAGVPPERILHLSLDLLVAGDRDRAYESLLGFLGIGDEPEMRDYFDREMSAAAANRERWRSGLSDSEQAELSARYDQVLGRLAERGYATAPVLRAAYERLG